VKAKKEEYDTQYKPELERRRKEREEEKKTEGLDRLMKDMGVGSSKPGISPSGGFSEHTEPVHVDTISDGEDEDDGYLVDPDAPYEEDEGLQQKFEQARRSQVGAEDQEFERWVQQVNRGGL